VSERHVLTAKARKLEQELKPLKVQNFACDLGMQCLCFCLLIFDVFSYMFCSQAFLDF
jgi:hypothetical protein